MDAIITKNTKPLIHMYSYKKFGMIKEFKKDDQMQSRCSLHMLGAIFANVMMIGIMSAFIYIFINGQNHNDNTVISDVMLSITAIILSCYWFCIMCSFCSGCAQMRHELLKRKEHHLNTKKKYFGV